MLHPDNNQNLIHLNIANGHLMQYCGKDMPEVAHKAVEGVVTAIRTVNKTIKNQAIRYLYIYMKDGEEIYSIQVPLYKSAGPNIIRSLKNAIDTLGGIIGKSIKIETYSKARNEIAYTNANIYLNDQKLSWAPIPNGVEDKDAIDRMVADINVHLKGADGTAVETVEDMPSGDAPEEESHNPFDGL